MAYYGKYLEFLVCLPIFLRRPQNLNGDEDLIDVMCKGSRLIGSNRLDGVIEGSILIPPPQKLKETVSLVAKTILTDFIGKKRRRSRTCSRMNLGM